MCQPFSFFSLIRVWSESKLNLSNLLGVWPVQCSQTGCNLIWFWAINASLSQLGIFIKKENICLKGKLNPRLAGIGIQRYNQLSQVTVSRWSHIIIFSMFFSASWHIMPFDDQQVSDLFHHYHTTTTTKWKVFFFLLYFLLTIYNRLQLWPLLHCDNGRPPQQQQKQGQGGKGRGWAQQWGLRCRCLKPLVCFFF